MKIPYFVISLLFGVIFLAHAKAPAPEIITDNRPALIDQYYSERNMPLAGYGTKMVEVADKYGLDWRLLPAIAVREQSGGKVLPHNCPNRTVNYNVFGWASAKVCFTSYDQAIETVGMKLATLPYYKGKDLVGILQTYNPPSIVAAYAYEVIAIMEKIENGNILTAEHQNTQTVD